eukprot:c53667_g1_i1 orf=8-265(-)
MQFHILPSTSPWNAPASMVTKTVTENGKKEVTLWHLRFQSLLSQQLSCSTEQKMYTPIEKYTITIIKPAHLSQTQNIICKLHINP